MRKNRRELPSKFTTGNRRSVGSSLFGFSDRQTFVSHVPKKNKAVVLLSTMHNDNKVDEHTGLPEIILDYNAAKAAVDRVDQLRHNVQKRTACRKEQSAGHLPTSTTASISPESTAW